ncbi:MAG: LysR family transcriptional regulator [Paralcaligenes sp.]
MRYDITDLKVFLAVVEAGNLSRGAQQCHLSPSSVSLRVKRLENVLGSALLVRHPHGVGPTPAGLVVVEHAYRCLAELEQMHTNLLPYSQGIKSHIRLFANSLSINSYIPRDLVHFFKQYPSVRVSLAERTSEEIVAAVSVGQADVGVVAPEVTHSNLTFLPYHKDRLVLLVPLDNELAKQSTVHFTECLQEPFISLPQGASLHSFLIKRAAALGSTLDIRVQVAGYHAITLLVASGAGVAIVPHSALRREIHKDFVVVALSDPWARRDLRICITSKPDASHYFRDRLVATLRSSFTAKEICAKPGGPSDALKPRG